MSQARSSPPDMSRLPNEKTSSCFLIRSMPSCGVSACDTQTTELDIQVAGVWSPFQDSRT